jgi:crotonobetainyl-CoA:carnitine CoA-transferase CaiB-like acyl-CoA transferase
MATDDLRPMDGVRILEVADHTFVPAASAVLSDWGADVVKIEHAERGDAARGLASSGAVDLTGQVHAILEHANRGKRSLGLNLQSPGGIEVLYRLAELSDVFLTNKPPALRERLGIDEPAIRERNSGIVYAAGTAWGAAGPERDRGGYDMTSFWCRSGAAIGCWYPDEPKMPAQPGPAYGDSIGAMTIAGGISTALLHRERTGVGASLEVSLLGTGLWAMGAGVALSHLSGSAWRPFDVAELNQPMLGNFVTADEQLVNITCLQPLKYFHDFCRVLGRRELIEDERFATHEALATNSGAARDVVVDAIGSRTLDQVKELLADFSGQWTPVLDSVQVIDDPQVVANGYVQEAHTADGTPFKLVAAPVQFNGQPAAPGRAPHFNEHGDEILTGDLGLTEDQVLELKIDGSVT